MGIGKLQEIKINAIAISAFPTTLFGEAKSFDEVEATSVSIDQDSLVMVPEWIKPQPAGPSLQVRRLKLKSVKLAVKGLELQPFDADIMLGSNGALQRARLSDGKLRLDISPKDKAIRVGLEASNWKPPLGPGVEFDELALEAIFEPQQASITNIEGKIGFAPVKGGAKANWSGGGIRVEGDFSVTNGDLAKLMAMFTRDFSATGQLNTSATYALQGTTLENLFAEPKVEATFNIDRGVLNNVDLVRPSSRLHATGCAEARPHSTL